MHLVFFLFLFSLSLAMAFFHFLGCGSFFVGSGKAGVFWSRGILAEEEREKCATVLRGAAEGRPVGHQPPVQLVQRSDSGGHEYGKATSYCRVVCFPAPPPLQEASFTVPRFLQILISMVFINSVLSSSFS